MSGTGALLEVPGFYYPVDQARNGTKLRVNRARTAPLQFWKPAHLQRKINLKTKLWICMGGFWWHLMERVMDPVVGTIRKQPSKEMRTIIPRAFRSTQRLLRNGEKGRRHLFCFDWKSLVDSVSQPPLSPVPTNSNGKKSSRADKIFHLLMEIQQLILVLNDQQSVIDQFTG